MATKFLLRFQVLIFVCFFSAAEFVSLPEWQFHGYTVARKGEVGKGWASVQHLNIHAQTIFQCQVVNNGHSFKFTLKGSPPQVPPYKSETIIYRGRKGGGWYWYCEDLRRRSLERRMVFRRRRKWRRRWYRMTQT